MQELAASPVRASAPGPMSCGGPGVLSRVNPRLGERVANVRAMPSFDVVSEVDMQEVRNAVDQADRELSQRFDFKGTNSSIELKDKEKEIEMKSVSEDRINAVRQVLEEKLVKRKLSLKAIEHGK